MRETAEQKGREQNTTPPFGVVRMVTISVAVNYTQLLQGKHKPQYRYQGKTYRYTPPETYPIHRHTPKKMILSN